MLTEIEMQNKIFSTISKLEKCNDSVISNVLKQYNCESIESLKVMLENYRAKVYTALGGAAVLGAGIMAGGASINHGGIVVAGGAMIGVAIVTLTRLLLLVRAWKKQEQKLKEAKQSGNIKNINEINEKINKVNSKISETKTKLKHVVSKLTPEKKAKFLKKAELVKAKFK